MRFPIGLLFALTLMVGLVSVLLAARLYQRGRRSWLRHYLYYVTSFCLLEFLNLVAVLITRTTLQDASPEVILRATLSIYIVVLPLAPLPVYFLFLTALGLYGRKLTRPWRVAMLTSFVAILALTAIAAGIFLSLGDDGMMFSLGRIINTGAQAAFFTILIYTLLQALFRRHKAWRIGAGGFALLALTGFAAYAFFPEIFPAPSEWSMRVSLRILLFYLQLIPPTVFLMVWQPRFQVFVEPSISGSPRIPEEQLAILGVTPREIEIISLVVSGLSNRQIEDRLFISRHTVKNHLHNIFRKLDINSRMQLVVTLKNLGKPSE